MLLVVLATFTACTTDDGLNPSEEDGGSSDAALPDGATPDAGGGETLLDAPAAEEVGSLELDEPIADVVHAEDLVLGLHEEDGVSILDLSDPTEPAVIAHLPTTGRAIAVALDVRRRILFIVTVSGDLRAYRVADPSGPAQIAQTSIAIPETEDADIQGMARVGDRLFLLAASQWLVPVNVLAGAGGTIGFGVADAIALADGAERIAAGGGVLFLSFAGGRVQVWSAGTEPAMIDQAQLGADVTGWVVRGRRLFVALDGLGLRVVDMTVRGQLRILFEAPEFSDPEGLERHGNLVVVALARGLLVVLDLSDFAAPRALVTWRGTLPSWVASVYGNLLLGDGRNLSVFGVPPFVTASVPAISRGAFPRYGRIPLQLSKPVDAATVTVENVRLRCGGAVIEGTVVVSPDRMRITFLPSSPLPGGMTCGLTLDGVRDELGLSLSSGETALTFTTASAAPAPVDNPQSSYTHTADGEFTDWEEGKTEDFEYFDVTAARGMYSYFYADFDGEKLWLLNDWFYGGEDIDPDCYNQFGVWTGNGAQAWDIRAYGDQRIEVRLNGQLLEADDERVTGGYGFVGSPNDPEPHTIYELAIATEPGSWGVQLHDPGPTFSCHRLETDPTHYEGESDGDGSVIDPTQPPVMPVEPVLTTAPVLDLAPLLSWTSGDQPAQFTTFLFELAQGEDMDRVIYRVTVYGQYLLLPYGLVQQGMAYTWRVTAYTLVGSIASDPVTFTVGGEPPPDVEAPELSSVEPSSVVQNEGATLTITGTGFVEGARAYFDGTELNTTFESGTQLVAMLPETLTGTAGTYELTVRNLPSDETTESNALDLLVQEPVSNLVTLVSLDPEAIPADTSTEVTVTLTNGASGFYNLVLTPVGGGTAVSTFCDWTAQNQCQAYLEVVAGAYHATIRVGEGETAYDTNTLENALVATSLDCHDECLPGPRMSAACSSCAAAVCDSMAACCSESWGSACVDIADTHGSCGCSAPSLTGLNPEVQEDDDETAVTVDLTDAPAGYEYTLILTPDGSGEGTSFACAHDAGTGDCTATVSGLAAGPYDARVRVRHVESDQSFFTGTLGGAFLVSEAGGGGGSCFDGGEPAAVSGSGTCSTPFVIDLSGDALGTIKTHSNDSGDNESFGYMGSNCEWVGTVRHDIYRVVLPVDADGFEVTVDPASDANPRIAVLEGNACGQPNNLCADANGATECEYANAEQGPVYFGNETYFVVAVSDQGVTTTVRVRAY